MNDEIHAEQPSRLPREEWERRRRRTLKNFSQPHSIGIVCSHKDRAILAKRPATLGEAIIEMDPAKPRHIFLNWNPVRGNMNNRMNRKGNYHPVAIDQAVPPISAAERERRGIPVDYLELHDVEGMERSGVKGMSKTRRNAVSNHNADQFICPRCTMHVSRDHDDVMRVLEHMAKDGMTKLDIQHLDLYIKLLPPQFKWL